MTERLPTSSTYGAEEVLEDALRGGFSDSVLITMNAYQRAEADPAQRSAYDKAVLGTLYYHNWFTGRKSECPTQISSCSRFFLSHAFWVGIAGMGQDPAQLRDRALSVSLTPAEVLAFDEAAATQNALYTYGSMPREVVQRLSANWTNECDIKGNLIIGVSVLSTADHPVPCPSDLRYQEVERVVPRLMPASAYTQSWFFVFYYDLRPFVQAEAAFSIVTTVFICVILCIASIMFTSTANALVLAPVEKMMRKVEAIRSNPLAATKLADDEFQREERERRKKAEQSKSRWKQLKDPGALCRPLAGGGRPAYLLDFFMICACPQSASIKALDPSGGFFQSFYIDGRKFNPEFRQIVSSSRMVINFMLAGKLLQDPKLVEIGRHGLEYIEKVHYIPAKQSYAFTVRNHKPEDMVEQAYGYAFILAAHAAARAAGAPWLKNMYSASCGTARRSVRRFQVAKDNADVGRVFDLLERKFWLPDKGAYLDTISAEGVVDNSYRGQNSNMHMCEALIAAYEATKETRYLDRAEVLAETFAAHLGQKESQNGSHRIESSRKLAAKGGGLPIVVHWVPSQGLVDPAGRGAGCLRVALDCIRIRGGGFVWEHYDVNFEIDWASWIPQHLALFASDAPSTQEYNKNDPTNIYRPWGFQPGHQIEWAKNLLNIYRHRPKFWMVNRAKELFDGAWELSWDECHGGLVYGFGPDRKWCDSEKYFWVQGESIATASLLYEATKDPKYIEKYVCLWQYCWKHWVDHEHGGWLCFKMSRSNERTNDEKAMCDQVQSLVTRERVLLAEAIAGGKCDYHTLVSCVEALRPFK
ncbi:yihS [Symbiodinium natans]|uniref:N-acylglucosamine 2-epimerase n=1 Tax=Symbiodinium natans TaxID=878477 RepID=A0A812J9H6_9DINO|nr:yihS [Symbiodinium natans]